MQSVMNKQFFLSHKNFSTAQIIFKKKRKSYWIIFGGYKVQVNTLLVISSNKCKNIQPKGIAR